MAVVRHYGHLPRAKTQAICCVPWQVYIIKLLILLLRHFKYLYLALYLAVSAKNPDTGCIYCICATKHQTLYLPTRGIARKRQDLRFMWAGVVYVNGAGPMLEARVPSLKGIPFLGGRYLAQIRARDGA